MVNLSLFFLCAILVERARGASLVALSLYHAMDEVDCRYNDDEYYDCGLKHDGVW